MKKTWRGMASAFVAAVLGSVPFVASVATLHASAANAANPAGSNSVAIGNFNVYYPDGWSTLQSGRLVVILNVSPDQQAGLGDRYVFTPQVNISTEQSGFDVDLKWSGTEQSDAPCAIRGQRCDELLQSLGRRSVEVEVTAPRFSNHDLLGP